MDRLREITRHDIQRRYHEFKALTHFEDIDLGRVEES
jgi:hypothetical protein